MNNVGNIENKLLEFNRDIELQELRNRYNSTTILDALGVVRSETSHSAMLKWLLEGNDIIADKKNSSLMRFLDILIRRDKEQNNKIDASLKADVLLRKIQLENVVVESEQPINKITGETSLKKTTDRIDVYITADIIDTTNTSEKKRIVIVIENKIKSSENGPKYKKNSTIPQVYKDSPQTTRYFLGTFPGAFNEIIEKDESAETKSRVNYDKITILNKKVKGVTTYYLYVFLTPASDSELVNYSDVDSDIKPSCPLFIHINYQDIANDILIPLIKSRNQSSRISIFLRDYMNALTIPGKLEDENKNKKEMLILATAEEDRATLNNAYKNYMDLIKSAAYCKIEPNKIANDTMRNDWGNAILKIINNEKGNDKKGKNELNNGDLNKLKKAIKNSNTCSMLIDFYDQNQAIILATLKILSDSDYDGNSNLRDLYDILSGKKPRQKYCVNYKNEEIIIIGHNDLVRYIVQLYANEHKTTEVCSFFNNQETLIKQPKSVVYDNENVKSIAESRYSKKTINVQFNNDTLYCSNQWTPDNIKLFIDYIHKKSSITIKLVDNVK